MRPVKPNEARSYYETNGKIDFNNPETVVSLLMALKD